MKLISCSLVYDATMLLFLRFLWVLLNHICEVILHSKVKYYVIRLVGIICIFCIHPLGMKIHFTSFADNYAKAYITLTAHVANLFIPLSSLLSRNKMLYLISAYNSAQPSTTHISHFLKSAIMLIGVTEIRFSALALLKMK